MSYVNELMIARKNGETVALLRTYRGKRWICVECLKGAVKRERLRHMVGCKNVAR